jgi:hypothetical protein
LIIPSDLAGYINVNSYVDFKIKQKIIKFKIIILLHSLSDYMVLTVKRYLKIYKKYDHGTINKLKYIILAQRVATTHNATY